MAASGESDEKNKMEKGRKEGSYKLWAFQLYYFE